MMKVITGIKEMQFEAENLRREGRWIGFVPTMGYLHEGHLSLIRAARRDADVVVVSIYVNPAQFSPEEDLEKYPRDFQRDENLARDAGADILFYPSDAEIYPSGYQTWITVEELTRGLCGASRPTHFRGVTTICAKLFNIVKPNFAVFGQKDAQQAIVIRRMVRDLNMDMEIVVEPIVRESDGLAMSSRNRYLSPEERADALVLYHSLQAAEAMIGEGEGDPAAVKKKITESIREKKSVRIDYIEITDAETLTPLRVIDRPVLIALAAFVGSTRLIDNVIIHPLK
jgi:pantoate--beta-alanine ligase